MCIFCNIIKGEIPSYKVYEDEHVYAFLDINPCAKGHTVLIPKKHGETVLDFEENELAAFFSKIKIVVNILKEKLGKEDFTIGVNHGAVAGQSVGHLHVHIIPREKGDGGGSMHSIVNNPSSETPEEVAKLFV